MAESVGIGNTLIESSIILESLCVCDYGNFFKTTVTVHQSDPSNCPKITKKCSINQFYYVGDKYYNGVMSP